MLVLSRKKHEVLHLGSDITIHVLRVRGNKVRIGIDAPPELDVRRGELAPREKDPTPQGGSRGLTAAL